MRWRLAADGLAGQVAGLRVGPDTGIAHRQVKQHGGRHDGHQSKLHVQANALFLQPAHDARGGVQPPGAAARQQNGMRPVYQVGGVQQVGLSGAGRCAPHIHAGHGAGAGNDHAAAGGAAGVGELADLNAGHPGDAVSAGKLRIGHGGRIIHAALPLSAHLYLAGSSVSTV